MKPIHQTKFGCPEGNCHAAAIASVMEIAIEDVPDFGIDSDWYDNFTRYMMANFGLQPFDVYPHEDNVPQGIHLINGKSPRGDFHHTVVGFRGKPIHDPHPTGNCKLESITSYTLFVILDPVLYDHKRQGE